MQELVIGILRIYKRWLSPMLPSACRFQPTCSEYMIVAVDKYGVVRGVARGLAGSSVAIHSTQAASIRFVNNFKWPIQVTDPPVRKKPRPTFRWSSGC